MQDPLDRRWLVQGALNTSCKVENVAVEENAQLRVLHVQIADFQEMAVWRMVEEIAEEWQSGRSWMCLSLQEPGADGGIESGGR